MARALVAFVVLTVLAGVLAAAASAALWLTFSTTRAAPGTPVTARTLGAGALVGVPSGARLRVFLVRVEDSGVTSPEDDRLMLLGELVVDAEGNGELRFEVPELLAGDYTTYTHCAPCAAFSGGRELLPTGPDEPFVVLAGGTAAGNFPVAPVAVGAAGGLVALAAVAWGVWRVRRQGRNDPAPPPTSTMSRR